MYPHCNSETLNIEHLAVGQKAQGQRGRMQEHSGLGS